MCGICGKVVRDGAEPPGPELMLQMTRRMTHRGPDSGGIYSKGQAALGHRRLAIIDLRTGEQPMCNEDQTVWIVYNGEVYNYARLRDLLVVKGHRFRSESDSEVIVHAYEEWGDECVTRLQGMFAFGIWDEKNQRLLLARDRIGIKPLYYAITASGIVFASEIKALLSDPEIVPRVDPIALDRFFTYGYVPGDRTLLQGVHKLLPARILVWEGSNVKMRQYWDLGTTRRERISLVDAADELEYLLRRIVKAHLISDVPIGVLLSGGVDSTAVLRYAAEANGGPLHTFTVGFDAEDMRDERPYARIAAQMFGSRHCEVILTKKDFLEGLPLFVRHMEEPVFEPPAIALYYVSRAAREAGVKVLLSGEGGDEAFAGYQNYRTLAAIERLKKLPVLMRGAVRVLASLAQRAGLHRFEKYRPLLQMELAEFYLSRAETPCSPMNRMKTRLYRQGFTEYLGGRDSGELTKELFRNVADRTALDQMMYVDTKTWLPDDLLVKADKMTMAASVELRVPLLDSEVLEFAWSLPEALKVRGLQGKVVLKRALREAVPKELLARRKAGFILPYSRWLREGFTTVEEQIVDGLCGPFGDLLRHEQVVQITKELKQKEWNGKIAFCLTVLGLWWNLCVRDVR